MGVAFFHLLSLSFIHSSMKSELKSDLTIFLQYKLATITPHPVSLIHVYPQYIAFKILSFLGISNSWSINTGENTQND